MTGDPPDGGVVKEDSLDGALQYVKEIVVAANVRQFVEQKRFNLSGG